MDPATPTQDPVELIRRLDAETLRARLAEMDRERQALLVLLRAAHRVQAVDKKEAARVAS